jgi:hypothetical protein
MAQTMFAHVNRWIKKKKKRMSTSLECSKIPLTPENTTAIISGRGNCPSENKYGIF